MSSDDLLWGKIAPHSSESDLIGKTFLGRAREISVQIDALGVTYINTELGIDLYNNSSKNLTTPFKTIKTGAAFRSPTSGPPSFHGHPINNLFCWVTFEVNGNVHIECNGLTAAWFFPVGLGPEMYWVMQSKRGLSLILDGCCPFLPPPFMDTRYPDLDVTLDPCQFCFDGFNFKAPVFAVSPLDVALGPAELGTPWGWQAELQVCDLSGDDENTDPGGGPASPWNVLTRNCCATGEGGGPDGDIGEGDDTDDDPPPPGDCATNGIFCKIMVKRAVRGLGGNDVYVWCLPTENGRLTNYCVTDSGTLTCRCSHVDLAGNPIPNPNTTPPGTIIFVKCEAGEGGFNQFQDCNNYIG